jgi:homoserine kinase type II
MTVFTPLTPDQISALLARHQLTLLHQRPISEGIENSNYLLEARRANGVPVALVLTVFETLPAESLPWFIALLHRLQARGLFVPAPLGGTHALMEVAGKPAFLVPKLSGSHLAQADGTQLATLGSALAQIHLTQAPENPVVPPNPMQQLASLVDNHLHRLPAPDRARAETLLARWQQRLPTPVLCHGDLFRDNVLFNGQQLTGLLDFYNAGEAPAEYDLAVTMNDWCLDAARRPVPALETALLNGYQHVRPLDMAARMRLPLALAVAALRFWLSRLGAEMPGEEVIGQGSKDPAEFEVLFRLRADAL